MKRTRTQEELIHSVFQNMLSQAKTELNRLVEAKGRTLEAKFWKSPEGKRYRKALEIAHEIETKEPYVVAVTRYDEELRHGVHPDLHPTPPNWIYRELNQTHLNIKLKLENYVESMQLQTLLGKDVVFDFSTIQDTLKTMLKDLK